MGREEMLMEVLPPLDWEKVGAETWGDVVGQVKKLGTGKVVKGLLVGIHAEDAFPDLGWDLSPGAPAGLVEGG